MAGEQFKEAIVEADGFSIRYLEAGTGDALVYIHGAGGLRLSEAHDLLAETYRVIALEIPGFGASPENTRSDSMTALAESLNQAVAALGIETANLMGSSFGGKIVLEMAMAAPDKVLAAVLLAPAAIRLADRPPDAASPADRMALLHAHPERHAAPEALAPEVQKKQGELFSRLIGPARDAEFEARLKTLTLPVLALFGTDDRVIPPEAAHFYAEIMPKCHLVMVYDAAHALDADRPEAVASVTADFLARHERFLVTEESALIHP